MSLKEEMNKIVDEAQSKSSIFFTKLKNRIIILKLKIDIRIIFVLTRSVLCNFFQTATQF